MTALGRELAVAGGVARRGTYKLYTNPFLLVPGLLFPLLGFAGLAGGLHAVGNVPGFDYPPGYTTFQFAFVLVQAAAFQGMFVGFTVATDFERGFARRLLLASPGRVGIVVGYMLVSLSRFASTAIILTGIAVAAGVRPDHDPVRLLAVYAIAFLLNAVASLYAIGASIRIRSSQGISAIQPPVFILLFTSPTYVPLGLLTGWIRHVARWNPVTPVLEATRSLLAGQTTHVGSAFLVLACGAVVLGAWAMSGARRRDIGA